jgi:hypothetical protein
MRIETGALRKLANAAVGLALQWGLVCITLSICRKPEFI